MLALEPKKENKEDDFKTLLDGMVVNLDKKLGGVVSQVKALNEQFKIRLDAKLNN